MCKSRCLSFSDPIESNGKSGCCFWVLEPLGAHSFCAQSMHTVAGQSCARCASAHQSSQDRLTIKTSHSCCSCFDGQMSSASQGKHTFPWATQHPVKHFWVPDCAYIPQAVGKSLSCRLYAAPSPLHLIWVVDSMLLFAACTGLRGPPGDCSGMLKGWPGSAHECDPGALCMRLEQAIMFLDTQTGCLSMKQSCLCLST